MSLLSMNSHVAYGYVGNTVASFALRRLGIEVWPVHTVDLSNHPGYGAARGRVTEPAQVREVVTGLAEADIVTPNAFELGMLAGACVRGAGMPDALARAANGVHAVLRATQAAGRRELDLIGAQDALAAPPATLSVEAL